MSLTSVLKTALKHKYCEPVAALSDIYWPVPEAPEHLLHPQPLTVKAQQASGSTGCISHKSLEEATFAYIFLTCTHIVT